MSWQYPTRGGSLSAINVVSLMAASAINFINLYKLPLSLPLYSLHQSFCSQMAFSSNFLLLLSLLLLFSVVMPQASVCNGCLYAKGASLLEVHNRKLLNGLKRGNDEYVMDWELRKVPSGPDPLHHNGGSPKKPRTP